MRSVLMVLPLTVGVVVVTLLMLTLAGCGDSDVKADNGYLAQEIQSSVPGYKCFVILNGSGNAVGGNCARESN